MKNNRKYACAALFAGSLFAASAASAAVISWTGTSYVNTGVNKDTLGTGQFNTTGTIVYAENNGGGALSFDGINFSAGLPTSSYFAGGNFNVFYNAGGALANTATTAPNTGIPPTLVTLGAGGIGPALVIGQSYMIQALLIDSRTGVTIVGRTAEFDGVSQGTYANRSGTSLGDGLLVTGTFTADATSQSFNINTRQADNTAKGGQLNALILSQVPAPIPEPSTTLLGAIGALLLLRRRRA